MLSTLHKKTKDISFGNLFLKRFIMKLIVFGFMTFVAILVGKNITTSYCNLLVKDAMSNAAMELMQLENTDESKDRKEFTAKGILSKTKDNIEKNPFITESSLSYYDLNTRSLRAKSYQFIEIESQEVIDWWKKQTGIEIGFPIVSLQDDTIAFYEKYKKNDVYIDSLICTNNVLFPESLTAKDKDGKVIETFNINSFTSENKCIIATPVNIVGNVEGDAIYEIMKNYSIIGGADIQKEQDSSEEKSEVGNKRSEKEILYANIENEGSLRILQKTFTVQDTDYQIDCGYQANFWSGAYFYILMFELAGVLWCALSAVIDTKETFKIYR